MNQEKISQGVVIMFIQAPAATTGYLWWPVFSSMPVSYNSLKAFFFNSVNNYLHLVLPVSRAGLSLFERAVRLKKKAHCLQKLPHFLQRKALPLKKLPHLLQRKAIPLQQLPHLLQKRAECFKRRGGFLKKCLQVLQQRVHFFKQ